MIRSFAGAAVYLSVLVALGSAQATANGPNGTRAPKSSGPVVLRVEPTEGVDTTPPTVRVLSHINGQVVRQAINVIELIGVADDPEPNSSGIAEVQVKGPNDSVFKRLDGTTNWNSGPIQLNVGQNRIQYLAIDRADNNSGIREMTLWYTPFQEFNDLFGRAENLATRSGASILTDNARATKEFGEQPILGNEGGHSLWWYFIPTSDGVFQAATEGSNFDTLMALYVADTSDPNISITDLAKIVENDDIPGRPKGPSEVRSSLMAGNLYYLSVDGYGGATGRVQLSFSFAAFQTFPVTVVQSTNGTISPGTGPQAAGAFTVTATPTNRYLQFRSFTIQTEGSTPQVVTNNPFTFSITGPTQISAEFEPRVFTDDFERDDFWPRPYQFLPTNSVNWEVRSAQITNNSVNPTVWTSRVARTREGLPNGSINSLILVTNLTPLAFGSFEYHINTETNSDVVEFRLDGQVIRSFSGLVGWTNFSFQVPASGATNVEWRFRKDLSISVVNEGFFLDNLDLPIAAGQAPAALSVRLESNPPRVVVTGPPGVDLILETSTTLAPNSWSQAGAEQRTNQAGTTSFDISALSDAQRFFRVRQLN